MKKSRLIAFVLCSSLALPNLTISNVYANETEQGILSETGEQATDNPSLENATTEEKPEEVITTEETSPVLPTLTSESRELGTSLSDVASPTDATLTDALTSETKEVKAGETESIVINSNAELTAFLNRDDTDWNHGCYIGSKGKVEIELHGTLTGGITITAESPDPNVTKEADIVITGDAIVSGTSLGSNSTTKTLGSVSISGITFRGGVSVYGSSYVIENVTLDNGIPFYFGGESTSCSMSNITIKNGSSFGFYDSEKNCVVTMSNVTVPDCSDSIFGGNVAYMSTCPKSITIDGLEITNCSGFAPLLLTPNSNLESCQFTLKNATVTAADNMNDDILFEDIRGGSQNITLENCTFTGRSIFDSLDCNSISATNCTFNATESTAALIFEYPVSGTFDGCVFNCDDNVYFTQNGKNFSDKTLTFKNCTFDGDVGVYAFYLAQKVVIDNCTFDGNADNGLYNYYTQEGASISVLNSTFVGSDIPIKIDEGVTLVKGCTITGTSNADSDCVGILVKGGTGSSYGTTSTEASKIAAVTNGDYTGHIAFVNTTIKDCYTGIKAYSSISCFVSGCTITNVNSGFDGASAGNTNTLIYNTSFKAKSSPGVDSIGTGRFNGGPGIIDCDFEGFNVGVDTSSGGWVVKGCKFKNCVSKGIVPYMTYINDCTFEGGTTIFIDKGTAQDCIRGITMVGNNTNTGLASGPSRYIGGLGASSENGGDNSYFGYMSNHPYLALSQRNLTQGKVDISNLKRGIDASGTLAAGNVNISDVNIHDCEAGIYSESQVFVYGDSTFKDCDTGIEAGWIQFGTTQNTANKMLLFDTCDYGLKLDFNNSMTAQTGYPAKYKVKATNCGYGIYAEQSSNGNWTATDTPIELTNNTVGLYFKNNQFVSQRAPIICSGNGTSAIIDWPYGQRFYDNFQSTDSTLDVKLKGTMNFHVSGTGVPPADQSGRYTGNLKVYLDTPESMIQIDRPHDNASTIEFDMPDGDYVNGRVVAASASNDFTYANAYTAKKDGWIVTFIPRDLYPSGLTYGQSAFVLSEGCRVTYDYATNGGTSMDKNASGSADFMNGEDVFNQLLNAGKIDTTDPSYDEATVKQQYIDRYAACAVTTPLNKYNYRKNAQIDLTPKGVKVDPNGDVWECVGWNTNPDATTGLASLTAGSTNITLYAIYRKKVTVNYKTYDPASDYSQDVYLYNKQTSPAGYKYLAYAGGDAYKFEGYTLDKTSLSNLKKANDSITNTVDVYCVYTKGGKITYLDADGTVIKSETKDVKAAATDIVAPKYSYTVMAYPGKEGKVFNCWRGNNDSYKGGETITTGLAEITLKADVSDAPITRTVTVKGCLKYKDGTPIANKVIKLYEDTEITVPQVNNSISAPTVLAQVAAGTAAHEYQTTTDENGQYVFKDVKVGKYDLSLWDGKSKLGECSVTIADKASKKDAVAVTDARDDVDIEYAISGDIIDISALLAIDPPKDATVIPAKSENNGVKTGDTTPILPVVFILLGSMAGIAVINLARRRKREE